MTLQEQVQSAQAKPQHTGRTARGISLVALTHLFWKVFLSCPTTLLCFWGNARILWPPNYTFFLGPAGSHQNMVIYGLKLILLGLQHQCSAISAYSVRKMLWTLPMGWDCLLYCTPLKFQSSLFTQHPSQTCSSNI